MKFLNPCKYLPLLLIILFLAAFTACIQDPDEPPATSLSPGDSCPLFSVTLLDGSVITTHDLLGKTSVLVFFNTSCGDCRRELPVIQEVYDRINTEGKEVVFLCIARDQDKSSVENYWQENGLTLPVSPQTGREVYNLFASAVIPRIYIISPSLVIESVWSDDPMPSASDIISELSKINNIQKN